MRTWRNLFERLVDPEHLDQAARLTVRGKRRRSDVAWFLVRREAALERLREEFSEVEAVLLSTCNRVELFTAAETAETLSRPEVARFLGRFHGLEPTEIEEHLHEMEGEAAVRHLFTVASSLDSMVVGEPQILSQVTQAYELATQKSSAGPLTHALFQAVAISMVEVTNGFGDVYPFRFSRQNLRVTILY